MPITKTNQLMLIGKTIIVFCKNHMKDTNSFCGKTQYFKYYSSVFT